MNIIRHQPKNIALISQESKLDAKKFRMQINRK